MKIKSILACVAILALTGLTVWYQAGGNTPVTATISLSPKPTLENRKVTSEDGSMMVSGKLRVEIDSGTTTAEVPESDPLWKTAYENAQKQKQRENLAKK